MTDKDTVYSDMGRLLGEAAQKASQAVHDFTEAFRSALREVQDIEEDDK